jgi:hypothetical protein
MLMLAAAHVFSHACDDIMVVSVFHERGNLNGDMRIA